MSGQTIQLGGDMSSDLGAVEITNLDDFDLGLLGNQRKISGAPSGTAPSSTGISSDNGVEFVNLEDTHVSFNVRPTPVNDTIKILREGPMPPNEPTLVLNSPPASVQAPPPAAPAKTWFSLPSLSAAAPAESSSSSGMMSGLSSLFGGGSSSSAAPVPELNNEPLRTYLTPEQETQKKAEALTLLERMDRKGVGGTKMSAANSLEDIQAEVAKRKDSKGLEASIRFQRSMLTTVTSGMEFLNSRYDPLGVHLDGWSEQVNENVEDYDEIFEELYDKYKDKSKVAPEVRLIMSLGLSAAMCHVTNTMFKSKMPGMDDILRNNPDLAKQFAKAAATEAVGPGFANFMGLGGSQKPQRPMSAAPPSSSYSPMDIGAAMGFGASPMGGVSAPMGGMRGPPVDVKDPRGGIPLGMPPSAPTARREMTGPNMDDILQTLQRNGDPINRVVPPTADDDQSVGSAYTTETMRQNGISARKRKATTQQPTGSTLTLNV
jgi:hypothetical protein